VNTLHGVPIALVAVVGGLLHAACAVRGVAVQSESDASTPAGGGADASGSEGAPAATATNDAETEAAVVTNGSRLGASCVPEQEHDVLYRGATIQEIGIVPDAPGCSGGTCVIDHFNGLTSCPYGQSADGGVPPGAPGPCMLPGTSTPVEGTVEAWCSNRPPSEVVTCSCRCADLDGGTDDSGTFCACPDAYTCTQLVSSLGAAADPSLGGAYCIKAGTALLPDSGPCTYCDPTTNPCP
jgi:hypothetical protein